MSTEPVQTSNTLMNLKALSLAVGFFVVAPIAFTLGLDAAYEAIFGPTTRQLPPVNLKLSPLTFPPTNVMTKTSSTPR